MQAQLKHELKLELVEEKQKLLDIREKEKRDRQSPKRAGVELILTSLFDRQSACEFPISPPRLDRWHRAYRLLSSIDSHRISKSLHLACWSGAYRLLSSIDSHRISKSPRLDRWHRAYRLLSSIDSHRIFKSPHLACWRGAYRPLSSRNIQRIPSGVILTQAQYLDQTRCHLES
ncbi:hypothetical protein TNCV_863991 [Trichonephila clavipes]|nr:hypothetical protein TNCV_863991 [Trichonephila clavipes]